MLDKRFSEALEAAKRGAAAFEERQQQRAGLAAETEQLLAAGELVTLNEIIALEKRITDLNGSPELLAQLAPVKERLQVEAEAERAAAEAVIALAGELTALTEQEDIAPLHDRKPEIEKAFAAIGNAPRQAVSRYQEAFRKAATRLAQHYETLDLARWESYTLKLDICNELEKLNETPAN